MKTVTILKRARKLIEKGWTQELFARNEQGNRCSAESSAAVCWCIRGAMFAAVKGKFGDEFVEAETILESVIPPSSLKGIGSNAPLVYFNDRKGRTKAQVLALYERAIAKAEAK